MKIEEYQNFTKTTNCYPKEEMIECLTFGLCSEAGEVAGKLKKLKRDNTDKMVFIQDTVKELGDVMWYVSELANTLGISIDDILEMNKMKVSLRKVRGTIAGSGDER